MFFGIAVRGWWAFPILAVLFVVWVIYMLLRAVALLVFLLLRTFAPAFTAALVGVLGKLDARGVDRLETAAERHENGRERKQELAARAALRAR